MQRSSRTPSTEETFPILTLLKCLLASFLFTGLLLLLLALLLYKLGLTEKIVSIAIIAIYVLATFLAGFLTGKKLKTRKFLWGLIEGIAYFAILTLLSLILNGSLGSGPNSILTTFILCAAGGTLGGMLS